jgi:hypothetical protein
MAQSDGKARFGGRTGFLLGIVAGVAVALLVVALISGGSSGSKHHDHTRKAKGSPAPISTAPAGAGPSGAAPSASAGSSAAGTGPVSLSGWKLTLPVDKAGDLSGKAEELQTAAVTPPWLAREADGSLAFWAPAAGATTSNSEHSRTELVSDNDFTFGTGVHTLSAQLSVGQVPTTDPDICVGQVHGGGSMKSIPFVMLHWRNGSIVVIVKEELHGSQSQSITLLTGVPLNARFGYSITDEGNGTLGLSADYDGRSYSTTTKVVPAFMGTDERFQVGDYEQAVSSSSASDGGRVTFYAIQAS